MDNPINTEILSQDIKNCNICSAFLPYPPQPLFQFNSHSTIALIGQAPGLKVEQSGILWNDESGNNLRSWLNVSKEQFYNPDIFAIIPMGFCFPGSGKTGDLPPRPECAPKWHPLIWKASPNIQLTILIGSYSQKYYLKNNCKPTLTETVRDYKNYLPSYFPIVHPSPRNRIWQAKNPWFQKEVIPHLQDLVKKIIQ